MVSSAMRIANLQEGNGNWYSAKDGMLNSCAIELYSLRERTLVLPTFQVVHLGFFAAQKETLHKTQLLHAVFRFSSPSFTPLLKTWSATNKPQFIG